MGERRLGSNPSLPTTTGQPFDTEALYARRVSGEQSVNPAESGSLP